MNLDTIFNTLNYCSIQEIYNCIAMCKLTNKLNINYLWKILYERDYNINLLENDYYNKYKICVALNNFIIEKNLNLNLNSTGIDLILKKLTIIPTQFGSL